MKNQLIIDDDRPIGRLLTRREILKVLGVSAAGAAVVACAPSVLPSLIPTASPTAVPTATPLGATATPTSSGVAVPACVVRPALTEGPFFVDERLQRSDIRPDSSSGAVSVGIPLALAFAVSKVGSNTCDPFPAALVDVWHCNADGLYSDEASNNTAGQNFLRGYQLTDANGSAAFTTIYPGWYSGRTVHIHFKIRTDPDASSGLEFTSQLFFDESVTAQVFAQQPYLARGPQDTTNARDGIYQSGGSQLLLAPTSSGAGYAATFEIGVVA